MNINSYGHWFHRGVACPIRYALTDGTNGILYDVMQAMSYVAGSKTNANVQQKMLRGLDGLLGMLGRAA